jgi:hypothetical protein
MRPAATTGTTTFYFEWSDCFDGCDNYRVWHFKVVFKIAAWTYLGFDDWGFFGVLLPLPAPLNCNISTGQVVSRIRRDWVQGFPKSYVG